MLRRVQCGEIDISKVHTVREQKNIWCCLGACNCGDYPGSVTPKRATGSTGDHLYLDGMANCNSAWTPTEKSNFGGIGLASVRRNILYMRCNFLRI